MPNFSFLGCLEVLVLWLETNNKTTRQDNSVELEASLAPAEAEVGAVAKADQHYLFDRNTNFNTKTSKNAYFR